MESGDVEAIKYEWKQIIEKYKGIEIVDALDYLEQYITKQYPSAIITEFYTGDENVHTLEY